MFYAADAEVKECSDFILALSLNKLYAKTFCQQCKLKTATNMLEITNMREILCRQDKCPCQSVIMARRMILLRFLIPSYATVAY